MDAPSYLKSYGWKDGEALREGGLRKPILVKHKKDTKGLGNGTNDSDMWWERLFDGQLKNLQVNHGHDGDITFNQNNKQAEAEARKAQLPLYRMFVKGQGLAGTVGKLTSEIESNVVSRATDIEVSAKKSSGTKMQFTSQIVDTSSKRREEKILKKQKKKEKKEKKDKKEKKKKIKEAKVEKKQSKRDKASKVIGEETNDEPEEKSPREKSPREKSPKEKSPKDKARKDKALKVKPLEANSSTIMDSQDSKTVKKRSKSRETENATELRKRLKK